MDLLEELTPGFGGWTRFQSNRLAEPVFLRFADEGGRLVVSELFVASTGGLSSDLLRRIPLGQIEAWANDDEMAPHIRYRLSNPGPDLRTAVSYFSAGFGRASKNHWVKRMFDSQIPGSGEPEAPALPLAREMSTPRFEVSDDELRLAIPPAKPYPDDFYAAVAKAYQTAAGGSRAPSARIAGANSVPITSVHRWVRMARKRGLLPPAITGKAG